jgi:prepilin-type N-terminal cleavage/methylation domain-containing protein/prepilin-type processing-associated H-X9-DG protein
MMEHPRKHNVSGFTLVELLVVIGIIALLISILLPSLAKARKSANAVKCAANLRSIMQGVHMYAAQNKDYYPGSALSSGRHLFNSDLSGTNPAFSQTNCPGIVTVFDWMSPVARMMGLSFNEGGTLGDRLERFETLRTHPAFQCPEATQILAGPYTGGGGPACKVDVIISYNTGTQFHLASYGTVPGDKFKGTVQGSADLTSPSGWAPRLGSVRNSSAKIFVADGARYSLPGTPPDIDLNYVGSGGGPFGDIGAFAQDSHSWNRTAAPGNGASGNDSRLYGFRHGTGDPRRSGGPYRLNAGYFDGHVEALDDLAVSNPALWMPTGSNYDPSAVFPMCNDAAKLYGGNVARIVE